MRSGEWLTLLRLARHPVLAAATLCLLLALLVPALGYWRNQLEAEQNRLTERLAQTHTQLQAAQDDASAVQDLAADWQRWHEIGLVGAAARPAWFEAAQAIAGPGADMELAAATPIAGISGAQSHRLTVTASNLVEPEALSLAERLRAGLAAPWRIERLTLSEPSASGMSATIQGVIVHMQP